MSCWVSFFLGVGAGSSLLLGVLLLILHIASSTPRMALTSIAACLRGFASHFESLYVVLSLKGQEVCVAFEQIARAIERGELASYRCSGVEEGQQAVSGQPQARDPEADSRQQTALGEEADSKQQTAPDPDPSGLKPKT